MPKIRVFAGPNGSGKSSLFKQVQKQFSPIPFVNADEIEKEFNACGFVNLKNWKLICTKKDLSNFLKTQSSISLLRKASAENLPIALKLIDNCLLGSATKNSYEAALAAGFIRKCLLISQKSFAFETVMSHDSKLDELKKMKSNGFTIYLYFICTDSPILNIERVKDRISKGGHAVAISKIKKRYVEALNNLSKASSIADKTFFIDNSGKEFELLGIYDRKKFQLLSSMDCKWLNKYFLKIETT
jgi:predicted ABC-type ATPase